MRLTTPFWPFLKHHGISFWILLLIIKTNVQSTNTPQKWQFPAFLEWKLNNVRFIDWRFPKTVANDRCNAKRQCRADGVYLGAFNCNHACYSIPTAAPRCRDNSRQNTPMWSFSRKKIVSPKKYQQGYLVVLLSDTSYNRCNGRKGASGVCWARCLLSSGWCLYVLWRIYRRCLRHVLRGLDALWLSLRKDETTVGGKRRKRKQELILHTIGRYQAPISSLCFLWRGCWSDGCGSGRLQSPNKQFRTGTKISRVSHVRYTIGRTTPGSIWLMSRRILMQSAHSFFTVQMTMMCGIDCGPVQWKLRTSSTMDGCLIEIFMVYTHT